MKTIQKKNVHCIDEFEDSNIDFTKYKEDLYNKRIKKQKDNRQKILTEERYHFKKFKNNNDKENEKNKYTNNIIKKDCDYLDSIHNLSIKMLYKCDNLYKYRLII